jgi:outer membrane protein assembly factor BamD
MRDVRVTQIVLWSLLLLLLIAGCSRRQVTLQLSVEERYQRGMRLFEEGNYGRAIDEFRIVTMQFGGTEFADDAQFYLAESYFNRYEFILSASEYQMLVNTMTGSPWVPMAQYKLALSYYNLSPEFYLDQDYSLKAIDEMQTFIDFFPTHELVPDAEGKIRELTEKLARKEYENARLYMKLAYYRAATRYFDIVMERFHDTPYAEQAHIGKVEALIERERYEEADEVVRQFLRQYPNSSYRARAETLQRRIAAVLRGVGSPPNQTQSTDDTTYREPL